MKDRKLRPIWRLACSSTAAKKVPGDWTYVKDAAALDMLEGEPALNPG